MPIYKPDPKPSPATELLEKIDLLERAMQRRADDWEAVFNIANNALDSISYLQPPMAIAAVIATARAEMLEYAEAIIRTAEQKEPKDP